MHNDSPVNLVHKQRLARAEIGLSVRQAECNKRARRCKAYGCMTKLSMYNLGEHCGVHKRKLTLEQVQY